MRKNISKCICNTGRRYESVRSLKSTALVPSPNSCFPDTGEIIAAYELAGELKTGSVESENVTGEEHERRRKLALEK